MIDNYSIDEFDIIHQVRWKPMVYDKDYLSYYESKSDRTIKLGYQRLGWLLGCLKSIPESLVEIGYGTGTFVEAAQITGVADCFGNDIARYPLPDEVDFVEWDAMLERHWNVVAMFDVLEHIPDLSFVKQLNADYVAIAVPFCRWKELGDEWFKNWRMLLPDEHLHHFDPDSLTKFMTASGFECVEQNTFEDGIRLRDGETGPNILSGLYKRIVK